MRMRNAANILMSVCITNVVFHAIANTADTDTIATPPKNETAQDPQTGSSF